MTEPTDEYAHLDWADHPDNPANYTLTPDDIDELSSEHFDWVNNEELDMSMYSTAELLSMSEDELSQSELLAIGAIKFKD